MLGKNRFLGEVYIPLLLLNLGEDTYKQWYQLKDHVSNEKHPNKKVVNDCSDYYPH